jgi:uncharacterized membrane protein
MIYTHEYFKNYRRTQMKKLTLILLATLCSTQLMALETPKLACAGTEPFWGITTEAKSLSLDNYGDEVAKYEITDVSAAVGTQEGWTTLISAQNKAEKLSLIVKKEECNDGMSETVYKYSASVVTGGSLLIGCCNDN